jgi:hypothetical protein
MLLSASFAQPAKPNASETAMTTKQRQVKPVTGTVRWIRPLIQGKQLGRIGITNANGKNEEYDVAFFTDNDGAIVGVGLAKDDDTVYAIDTTAGFGWVCDCPDATFNSRECKHCKAVRAALTKSGQLPPAPQRQEPVRGEYCDIDDL